MQHIEVALNNDGGDERMLDRWRVGFACMNNNSSKKANSRISMFVLM